MTPPDVKTVSTSNTNLVEPNAKSGRNLDDEYLEELPDEVEMSLFDHLEELRQRIFYALIAVVLSIIGCFLEFHSFLSQLSTNLNNGLRFNGLIAGAAFGIQKSKQVPQCVRIG